MPLLNQMRCSIELGASNTALKEYRRQYGDGCVETFVAVPSTSLPFSIHLTSEGYISSGLAAFVYIDGKYQANRNRCGLPEPGDGVKPDAYKVDFRFRQKEEKIASGRFVGREWTFVELDTTTADAAPSTNERFLHNVGTIEVLVLRCKGGNVMVQPALETKTATKATSEKKITASVKAAPSSAGKKKDPTPESSAFGGMLGLFDGSFDVGYRGHFATSAQRQPLDPNDPRYWSRRNDRGNCIDGNGIERIMTGAIARPDQRMFSDWDCEQHTRYVETERASWPVPRDFGRPHQPVGPQYGVNHPPYGAHGYTGQHFARHDFEHTAGLPQGPQMPNPAPQDFNRGAPYDFRRDAAPIQQRTLPGPEHMHNAPYGNSPQQYVPNETAELRHPRPRRISNVANLESSALKEAAEQRKRLEKRHEELSFEVKSLLVKIDAIDERNKRPADAQERETLEREISAIREHVRKVCKDMTDVQEKLKAEPPLPRYNHPNSMPWQQFNAHPGPQYGPSGYGGLAHGGAFPVTGGYNHYAGPPNQPNVPGAWPEPQSNAINTLGNEPDWGNSKKIAEEKREGSKSGGPSGDKTDEADEKSKKDDSPWGTNDSKKKDDNPWVNSKSEEKKDDNPWGANNSEEKKEETTGWGNWGDNNNSGGDSSNNKSDEKKDENNGWDSNSGEKKDETNDWNNNASGDNSNGNSGGNEWVNNDNSGGNDWNKQESGGENWAQQDSSGDNWNSGENQSNKDSKSGKKEDDNNFWASNEPTGGNDGWNDSKDDDQKSSNNGWAQTSKDESHKSSKSRSSNAPTLRTAPSLRPKSYWGDWNKPSEDSKHTGGSKDAKPSGLVSKDHSREAYVYAARPVPTVPEKTKRNDVKHGVQAGKGAAYDHATRKPEYLDSMSRPYAVFRFKYRTRETLEKILKKSIGADVREVDREAEKERMLGLSKEELIAEMLEKEKKKESSRTKDGDKEKKKESGGDNWGKSSSKSASKKSESKNGDAWGSTSQKSASKKSESKKNDNWGQQSNKSGSKKEDNNGWGNSSNKSASKKPESKKSESMKDDNNGGWGDSGGGDWGGGGGGDNTWDNGGGDKGGNTWDSGGGGGANPQTFNW